MILKLTLFVPEELEHTKDVKKSWEMLQKVNSFYNIEIAREIIDKKGERELKSHVLWPISISKRIKIKQTKRTKSLYPQLILFFDDKPFTFYSQSYSKDKITIEDFLENLHQGKIKCLHDEEEIAKKIKAFKKDH